MKPLTKELVDRVGKLPKKFQADAWKVIGEVEFNKCADDIFYWLDPTLHADIPYVYTFDSKPLYECTLCGPGHTLHLDKRSLHLKLSHKIKATTDGEIKKYFRTLPMNRPFPINLPYVKPIIEYWLNRRYFACEKSRDMVATWTMIVCHTWEGIFHEGREIFYQSEKGSKTRELVERSFKIYKSQPKFLREIHPATFSQGQDKAGELIIPSLNSKIVGISQGPEQLRQYHPTALFVDEAAYHPEAEECFIAVKPALQGGGRYSAISSANPGFFMRLCRDLVE